MRLGSFERAPVNAVAEGFLVLALDDLRSGKDPLPLIDAARAELDFEQEGGHQDDRDELAEWLAEEQEIRV